MSFYQKLVFVLAGARKTSHCKYCRQPIEWATKLSTPRREGGHNKAKSVPLNANALMLRYERGENGVKCEVYDLSALHFTTCTKKADIPRRPRTFGGRT